MFDSGEASERARSLQTDLASLCAALDPDLIQLSEAPALWSCFDRMERLVAGAKRRLARKVEESRAWQAEGDQSAAGWMARHSGTTAGRAKAEVESSKQLAALPATDKAVADGALSAQQAEAVTDAATADPTAEADLLGAAKRGSLKELKDACQRAKARVEDDQARAKRLHDTRAARIWKGTDGSWNLHVRNAPEVGAKIEAILRSETERIFTQARQEGRREPLEAYRADALTALVLGEDSVNPRSDNGAPVNEELADAVSKAVAARKSRRPDTKVIVLIDYQALRRGYAEADETCEIQGVGPVPVATVRGMMADSFGAAIVTDGVNVYTVAHLGRSATAHQRTALEARGYRCEVPDCGSTTALEIDHVADWHYTHRTSLDQLCWLCRRHHLDKTHRGWRLSGAPGQRTWHPPDKPPGDPPSEGSLFSDPTAAHLN